MSMMQFWQTVVRTLRPARPALLALSLLPAAWMWSAGSAHGIDAEGAQRVAEVAAAGIRKIDDEMPGKFGVYLKWVGEGHEVDHDADRSWYLASTIKIPLAVAVLKQVEAGELALDQELVLAETDFVDGAGVLLYAEPGTSFTIDELIRNSIEDSDSTATDMLIRLLGEEELNRQVSEMAGEEEFGWITTILQVRYDAYAKIHTDVARLSNMDLLALRNAGAYPERFALLIEKLGIEPTAAGVGSVPEAFELYYRTGANSGSLAAMGRLLERLMKGELLSPENTARLLGYMQNVTTGDRRIKAGLEGAATFAHKTGTQVARACDVGVLNPEAGDGAIVVAACAEGFEELSEAEAAFESLGSLLRELAAEG
jgi:beta-lactamase class A